LKKLLKISSKGSREMDTYELLTLLASVVATVISATSLVRSRTVAAEQARLANEQLRLTEEQLELNRKLAEEQSKLNKVASELSTYQLREIEESERLKTKPVLNARFSKIGKQSDLVIVNRGQGSAYNVDVEFLNCEEIPLMRTAQLLPHPEIRPNTTVKIPAIIYLSGPLTYQIKLTWKDADGEQSDTLWVSVNS
jgi:hypothetical protein